MADEPETLRAQYVEPRPFLREHKRSPTMARDGLQAWLGDEIAWLESIKRTAHGDGYLSALVSVRAEAALAAPTPEPGTPPYATFKGAVCKGSFAFNTACGHCEKCEWKKARSRPGVLVMEPETPPFQSRVRVWIAACFGVPAAIDRLVRAHRFLEEALEMAQAVGCEEREAHELVAYVYGRPKGEVRQEAGGVMLTLAALCQACGIDMQHAGEAELARVWTKVETIRAKEAAKPSHSALPGPSAPAQAPTWRSLEADPPPGKPGTYVNVRDTAATTYRWLPYKPEGARQMRRTGRWQVATEHGYRNAPLPTYGEWTPNSSSPEGAS